MANILIALTGKAQAGKTESSKVLQRLVERDGLVFQKISFAEPLKKLATDWFGWDGDKGIYYKDTTDTGAVDIHADGQTPAVGSLPIQDKGRQLLINLGMKMREIRGTIWADLAYEKIRQISAENPDGIVFCIDDCRFRNELDVINRVQNSYIARIVRPNGQLNIDDISEKDLDNVEFKNVIVNDGSLEDLAGKVEQIYQFAKKGNI